MNTTSTGRQAEDAAANFLKDHGFSILCQNWRKPQCEIDIVAKKKNRIYFVEVKYRKSTDFGGGLDYITPKKQKQMQFAATTWCAYNNWTGDFCLSAIEVTGSEFAVTEFLEDIS
jgi:putative endonuclease